MTNVICGYVMVVGLLAIGCDLESQGKDQCTVQADCLDGYVCNASRTCELTQPALDAPTALRPTPGGWEYAGYTKTADTCGGSVDGDGPFVIELISNGF